MDDKTRAMLGDHEGAKRLTDAGVLCRVHTARDVRYW